MQEYFYCRAGIVEQSFLASIVRERDCEAILSFIKFSFLKKIWLGWQIGYAPACSGLFLKRKAQGKEAASGLGEFNPRSQLFGKERGKQEEAKGICGERGEGKERERRRKQMADKKEILKRLAEGIGIEKQMKETYTRQAEIVKDRKLAEKLKEIAKDEAEHEKIVERLWEKYGGLEGV